MFKTIKIKELNFALILLVIGIIIRAFYQEKYTVMLFQHDWQGHIEMIKYFANTWFIPLPGKGLEFPQQPLYYYVAAGIYSLSTSFGLNDAKALEIIGYFSFICSVIFLVYGYKFINLLTNNKQVKAISMVFLALTPSLVYLSARINNDALVMALSSMSLYYVVKSYQSQFKHFFYIALILVSLLFLTKISTLGIELLFFALILMVYKDATTTDIAFTQQRLYLFGLVGFFVASYTLWRVYLPIDSSFHLVNSGRYPGQILPSLDLNYFLNTHFKELIATGQSYIFGEGSIRYSFMTYQYGTMFFGEFDYTFFSNKTPWLKEVMQSVLLFGLVFILGFVSYLFKLYKASSLQRLFFIVLLINLILILKFMFDYPSICNTDFRYFVSSFLIFSYVFAQGLAYLTWLHKVLNIFLVLLVGSEIVFFIGLIY